MTGKRTPWESLSPAYRKRLESKGITKSLHERGVSLKTARGHSKTPEHGLREALREPRRYKKYLDKKNIPKGRGGTPLSPEEQARRFNDILDRAYNNMYRRLHTYQRYNDETVRANIYGGVTAESGEVAGMVYSEAFWTSIADTEEIRSSAREQYRGNPWWYH